MKPLGQLPDGTAVFIDANIFVLAGSTGPIGLQCQELISRVRQGLLQGFTATFVVAEVTHRVIVNEAREQLQRSARETIEYLQQNPAFIRSLKRHLMVASDIGKAGVNILPLTVIATAIASGSARHVLSGPGGTHVAAGRGTAR